MAIVSRGNCIALSDGSNQLRGLNSPAPAATSELEVLAVPVLLRWHPDRKVDFRIRSGPRHHGDLTMPLHWDTLRFRGKTKLHLDHSALDPLGRYDLPMVELEILENLAGVLSYIRMG